MLEAAELYTHTQLRRCLAFLLFVIIPYNSFALDACAPNDTVAIVLDPSIGSQGDSTYDSNYSFDINTMTWRAPYSHVTYYGVSACLSSKHETVFHNVYSANNGILIDNGKVVVGGEQNVADDGTTHCWCRLSNPVVSKWLYNGGFNNMFTCVNGSGSTGSCVQACVGRLKNRPVMRANLFNSVQ